MSKQEDRFTSPELRRMAEEIATAKAESDRLAGTLKAKEEAFKSENADLISAANDAKGELEKRVEAARQHILSHRTSNTLDIRKFGEGDWFEVNRKTVFEFKPPEVIVSMVIAGLPYLAPYLLKPDYGAIESFLRPHLVEVEHDGQPKLRELPDYLSVFGGYPKTVDEVRIQWKRIEKLQPQQEDEHVLSTES